MRLLHATAMLLLAATLFVPGCDGCAPEPKPPVRTSPPPLAEAPTPMAEPSPTPSPTPAAVPFEEGAPVEARVRIVDLKGNPLEGMAPIASATPNAFQEPVTRGALTDAEGRSTIPLPPGEELHIRGWDPKLTLFANNFQTWLGQGNTISGELELVMVPGAAVRATFAGPDRQPLAQTEVRLMMHHPTRGPWWPASAATGEHGDAVFNHIPAGRFLFDFMTPEGKLRQLPETTLPIGVEVDLGLVVFE